jgi:hypothetical protein
VPYGTGFAKRAPTDVFPAPHCLKAFKEDYGNDGISKACNCFNLPTPTAVTKIVTKADPLHTVTSTHTVEVCCDKTKPYEPT